MFRCVNPKFRSFCFSNLTRLDEKVEPVFILVSWCALFNVSLHFSTFKTNLDVLLTVRLGITLVNDQLDTQFFYFIIRLLQSSVRFEQRRSHHQEVKFY